MFDEFREAITLLVEVKALIKKKYTLHNQMDHLIVYNNLHNLLESI